MRSKHTRNALVERVQGILAEALPSRYGAGVDLAVVCKDYLPSCTQVLVATSRQVVDNAASAMAEAVRGMDDAEAREYARRKCRLGAYQAGRFVKDTRPYRVG